MSVFVTIADFKNVGNYKIPTDKFTTEALQYYIDFFYFKYLINLLGADFYKSFLADYTDANPTANKFTEDKYKAIYNPILEDDNCEIVESEGIKIMLCKFIYYEYSRDNDVKQNIGGNHTNKQSNSDNVENQTTNLNTVYNQAIDSYNAIQYYIDCFNPEKYNYSDFNGVQKLHNSII